MTAAWEQISYWDRSAAEPDVDAPLDGDATADVAIVGGGFTGLSTALHGADRGLDCLVLEAERIGHGGSGRNVGLVNAGVWHPPRRCVRRWGRRTARGSWNASARHPNTSSP
jgi:glycine/D-amino acid oxidase-like deaminating enzyme